MSEQSVTKLTAEVAEALPNMPLIDIIKVLAIVELKLKEPPK